MIEKLKGAVVLCNTLEEVVNAFFDVVACNKGEIEYIGGSIPAIYNQPGCKFMLQYSRELEDGEFYQLSMDVKLDAEDKTFPYDHKIYDEKDGDLRDYILNSELFKKLNEMTVVNIDVFDAET